VKHRQRVSIWNVDEFDFHHLPDDWHLGRANEIANEQNVLLAGA
jgi:hypothetical protein